ncbi:MAG: cation-translocating P-type ATPase [Candidatus Pacebacteria bacterium]|nr:cation-translocating P-type ATPase [Candidatus Paceibacterota bacterium]
MYHAYTQEDTLTKLETKVTGLSSKDVTHRRASHGPNALPEAKKKPWYIKFIAHFNDFLMLILLGASVFSLAIGEIKDGIVIATIVVANACMGYLQEMKADNAINALKKLSGSSAKVIRDGAPDVVDARDLVPGDIIILENGDRVPADARLLEAVYLKVSESSLTGESKPSEKNADFVGAENLPLGDRKNSIYKDTLVVFGRGTAVVTTTGKHTEMGKIFSLLEKSEATKTPLAIELKKVGKGLTIFACITAVVILVALMLSPDGNIKTAILTAISMAIAVVPEGIPAVVTTVLAISVARLAKNHAIIRKMDVVETLGAATCILTDKTGTLTKNEMTVTQLNLPNEVVTVSEKNFEIAGKQINAEEHEALKKLLYGAILCNDAHITEAGKILGDPTEACLLAVAKKANIDVTTVREMFPRIHEIPFSSDTKRMTVVVKDSSGILHVITKGAAESVAQFIGKNGDRAKNIAEELSLAGTRNLTCAWKTLDEKDFSKDDLSFLENQEYIGVIGCKDPLRPEVREAVAVARDAGIRTIMITGDHKLIAENIGTELGIIHNSSEVIDGVEFNNISKEDLPEYFEKTNAFSRVSPEQKLEIVRVAQKCGETVIVTGDGVNDAPAIKTADIGVAMGITGTDVAKEAADVVLQDDNYSTIVRAIKQGRGIFGNFIKFLKYQISCNLSGVMIVLPVSIATGVTPLVPVHILLLNLISETGPSIALGLEKPEKNIMKNKPRNKHERLLTRTRWIRIVFEAGLLAIAGIASFVIAQKLSPASATSAVLATAFLSRLWHALSSRSETLSAFSGKLERNMSLYYTIAGTLACLAIALYTPIGNTIINTVPLTMSLLGICFALSLFPFFVMELYKVWLRKFVTTSAV